MIYALVASVSLVFSAFALLTHLETIDATGSIKSVGLGVYSDLQCTNAVSSLEFGQLEPGSSKSFNLYLKNEGNADLTLSMTSENWNPTNAAGYMTLTWTREGQQISSDEVLEFVITLTISETVQGINSFSFDIIISGTG